MSIEVKKTAYQAVNWKLYLRGLKLEVRVSSSEDLLIPESLSQEIENFFKKIETGNDL